jgi:hypothetical protein
VPKHWHNYVARKIHAQLGGRIEGIDQSRSLHHPFDDNPLHGACRLAPTDPDERLQRSGLFGDRMFSAKTLETPAERLQRSYRANQSAPPGFRRKAAAIAERGVRNGGNERVIVKLGGNKLGPIDLQWSGVIRVVASPGKEVKLSGAH